MAAHAMRTEEEARSRAHMAVVECARGRCGVPLTRTSAFWQAFDLADVAGKQMCSMKGHQVLGNTYTKCDSPAILKEFIERVYGNRKVVATKMNEGSVRSTLRHLIEWVMDEWVGG